MLKVESICVAEAKPWILYKHYARRMPCVQYAFGLYDDTMLVGICTYGQPASAPLCKGICGEEWRPYVLELNRLCVDSQVQNAAGMLVANSLKLLPQSIVVSYADIGRGHVGYVYQATNWLYTGKTQERTDIYSEHGHARHHCGDISQRQYRSPKHRYVYFVGTKSQRKQMRKALNYEIQPYPKGETRRYDDSAEIATQQVLF